METTPVRSLELREVKHSPELSQETQAFTAQLFINGEARGEVSDAGDGGAMRWTDPNAEDEINAYGETLPMIEEDGFSFAPNAETIICGMIIDKRHTMGEINALPFPKPWNPRFVWLNGCIHEEFPDLPDPSAYGDEMALWDRQEQRAVMTVHPAYANAICLEVKGKEPFTEIEQWFNQLDNAELESEGMTPTVALPSNKPFAPFPMSVTYQGLHFTKAIICANDEDANAYMTEHEIFALLYVEEVSKRCILAETTDKGIPICHKMGLTDPHRVDLAVASKVGDAEPKRFTYNSSLRYISSMSERFMWGACIAFGATRVYAVDIENRFRGTAKSFQAKLTKLAMIVNWPPLAVYRQWMKYDSECFDQSCLLSEFVVSLSKQTGGDLKAMETAIL